MFPPPHTHTHTYTHTHTLTRTHTLTGPQVQDAVVLIIDRQHDVGYGVGDLVVGGQVQWRHAHRPDHILNLRVVSDDAQVLDVIVAPRRGVPADTLVVGEGQGVGEWWSRG